MYRIQIIVIVTLLVCLAQSLNAKGQQSTVAPIIPKVGEVYEVKANILGATNPLWVDEVAKLMIAKDQDGLNELVDQGHMTAVGPKSGKVSLRVLEYSSANQFRQYGFAECRLFVNGENKGKLFVYQFYFNQGAAVKQ